MNKSEKKHVIRFAPGLYEKMLVSVGRWEPEQYALLGGRLDDPFTVLDLMPMPPASARDGRPATSRTTVTLNAPFIEHYLNMSLIPFGMNILGIMHSQPGGLNRLSGGIPDSGQGDLPSMRAHLETAARQGTPWENYLAPIVTHPGDHPQVTGYIVRLDQQAPIPADIVWDEASPAAANHLLTPDLVHDQFMVWQKAINRVQRQKTWPKRDRDALLEMLRVGRALDFVQLQRAISCGESGVISPDAQDIADFQLRDGPALLGEQSVRPAISRLVES